MASYIEISVGYTSICLKRSLGYAKCPVWWILYSSSTFFLVRWLDWSYHVANPALVFHWFARLWWVVPLFALNATSSLASTNMHDSDYAKPRLIVLMIVATSILTSSHIPTFCKKSYWDPPVNTIYKLSTSTAFATTFWEEFPWITRLHLVPILESFFP